MGQKIHFTVVLCLLLATSHLIEGKRSWSGSGRRTSSSNSGSRRGSTSSHTSVTKSSSSTGAGSHSDLAKLSYPSVNTANKPVSSGTHTGNNQPIGWNVPNSQSGSSSVNKPPSYQSVNPGPPPAYSPQNVPGGAKTNINEPPPAYKSASGLNSAPPSYTGNNQASYPRQQQPVGSGNPMQSYPHNIQNSGPIKAQTASPVLSSYPHNTGGANYPHQAGHYPSAGAYPAHPPPGAVPIGGGYHPGGAVPYGGGYPPAGAIPYGGGHPPAGAIPYGGGYPPAGAIPIYGGPQKSSGPGLGTGLIAGALGGAVLGHVLTPTHNRETVYAPPAGVPAGANQDRVIIINNTPGQQPTVTGADGLTVVNNQPQNMPVPNNQGQAVPLAPMPQGTNQAGQQTPVAVPPQQPDATNLQQQNPQPGVTNPEAVPPLAPFPNGTENTNQQPQQPAYQVMCYPIIVNVTSPDDPTKMIEKNDTQCYYVPVAPQPQQPPQPEGSSSQKPDLMQMPGDNVQPALASTNLNNMATPQKESTATWADTNKISVNNSADVMGKLGNFGTMLATLFAILTAYSLH